MDSYLTSQYESTHVQVKEDWNFSNFHTDNDYNALFGTAYDGVFFESEESMLSASPLSGIDGPEMIASGNAPAILPMPPTDSVQSLATPPSTDPYHGLTGIFSEFPITHIEQSESQEPTSQLEAPSLPPIIPPLSVNEFLPDGQRVQGNILEFIADVPLSPTLPELVRDISRRIIGMRPTITQISDINRVIRSRINWEIPTVFTEVPAAVISLYTPEKIAEVAIAYLKTLIGNYRAQTTERGKENQIRKQLRDRLHQQRKQQLKELRRVSSSQTTE